MNHQCKVRCAVLASASISSLALAQDPWADFVVSFDQGTENTNASYADPLSALGEPSRMTGGNAPFASSPSAVTPFNSPFNVDQVVSIGGGGSLVIGFDEPVTDDAANPYGIDLLIFGNASYLDTDFPNGQAGNPAALFSETGTVEVSADGLNWVEATGVIPDGAFPTLGYTDLSDPFSPTPGDMLSDFTKPVDPSFSADGLSFAQIVAGYNGSGGGAGIDLGALGLSEISFVRISNPLGSGVSPEIDAIVDVSVPAPGGVGLALLSGLALTRRTRTA